MEKPDAILVEHAPFSILRQVSPVFQSPEIGKLRPHEQVLDEPFAFIERGILHEDARGLGVGNDAEEIEIRAPQKDEIAAKLKGLVRRVRSFLKTCSSMQLVVVGSLHTKPGRAGTKARRTGTCWLR